MCSLICVSRHIFCVNKKPLPFLPPGGQGRRKLLGVLDSIDFVQNYPPSMELKFFKQSAMEQVIGSCEQRDETGLQLCNVKLLYQVLTSELNKLQGGSTGQRPHMLQVRECKTVNPNIPNKFHNYTTSNVRAANGGRNVEVSRTLLVVKL